MSAEQPLSGMRYKSHAAEDRQTEMFLLRTLPDKILSFEEKFGGMKMLVTVLCLTMEKLSGFVDGIREGDDG